MNTRTERVFRAIYAHTAETSGREVAKGLDSYLELGPGAIVLGKGDGSPEVFYDLTLYDAKGRFGGHKVKPGMTLTDVGFLQIPDELRGDEQRILSYVQGQLTPKEDVQMNDAPVLFSRDIVSLDDKIEMEAGLTLSHRHDTHVIGSSGDSYFAKLSLGCIGAKKRQPEGVRVQLQDIEMAIPEDLYQNLLERRGEGTAYGRVTIELYVRSETKD